jgi:hypothetical protein
MMMGVSPLATMNTAATFHLTTIPLVHAIAWPPMSLHDMECMVYPLLPQTELHSGALRHCLRTEFAALPAALCIRF